MIPRIILSVLLLAACTLVETVIVPGTTLIGGQAAGAQFQPSDGAYATALTVRQTIGLINTTVSFIGLLLLAAIWWGPVKRVFKGMPLALLALLLPMQEGRAYGKSLEQVTDGPVRNKIQALVCDEISARGLDEANAQANAIMKAIEGKARAYLNDNGIGLDFIGWADTFELGGKVQDAIDRRYVATKEAEIARDMTPYTTTLQALATAEATRTIADGLKLGKVALPTSLTIMDFGWLKDLFASATAPKPAAGK